MTPVETVVARALVWSTTGAAAAIPVLFLPQPEDPLFTMTAQASLVLLFTVGLAFHLAPLADEPWFAGLDIGDRSRLAIGWVAVTATVAATAGVVTVTTSAAFRYEPSIQYLQLIVTVWAAATAAAAGLGGRRRFGSRLAPWVAVVLGGVVIWALRQHLATVGFTPAWGWRVDGSEFATRVLPYWLGASAVATVLLGTGGGEGDGAG